MRERSAPGDVLLCLRALSIVLDLSNGLREDKSLATGLFAHRMALALGLDERARTDAFYAALLRHLGCTSYAHREASFVEDDVALRRALATSRARDAAELTRAIELAHPTADPTPALAYVRDAGTAEQIAWMSEACGGAKTLATLMGFGAPVVTALDEVFERHDGHGGLGRAGEEISLVARITAVAHRALAHHTQVGPDAARSVLARDDGELDPRLAAVALDVLDEHPDALLSGADDRLRSISATLIAHGPSASPRSIAEAFGDFADLQSRHTRGHARGVSRLVEAGSKNLGLPEAEVRREDHRRLLHDVGAAAVPTRIWETRDRWSEAMRERARMHVYYTERALTLAPAFADALPIAGAHHERLDAGGYHRGLGRERISLPARLLAAADVLHALTEDRPHRAARSKTSAKDELVLAGKDGALDPRAIEALIASPSAARRDGLARLTDREREVLRHVALGRTNKEIAVALGISDRTVQTHTLHVYEKLGVTTRSAAAILASRAGLLEPS